MKSFSFWEWLFKGIDGEPGYKLIGNNWLLVHLNIGLLCAAFIPVSLDVAASIVLLPLAGILIGLSFAWGGNANALIQTSEIKEVAAQLKGGIEDYIFGYQLAILAMFVTLALWALAALGLAEYIHQTAFIGSFSYNLVEVFLYGVASLALRECWHVVIGVQYKLVMKIRLEEEHKRKSSSDK